VPLQQSEVKPAPAQGNEVSVASVGFRLSPLVIGLTAITLAFMVIIGLPLYHFRGLERAMGQARALRDSGREDEAITAFQALLEEPMYRYSATAHLELGSMLLKRATRNSGESEPSIEQLDAAADAFRQTIVLDSRNVPARQGMAEVYMHHRTARLRMAIELRQRARGDRAAEAAEMAKKMDDGAAALLTAAGELLDEARQHDPGNPVTRYRLAQVYEAMDRPTDASYLYSSVVYDTAWGAKAREAQQRLLKAYLALGASPAAAGGTRAARSTLQ